MRKLVLALSLFLVLSTPALAAAPFASMTDTTGQLTGMDISTSLVHDSKRKFWMLETPAGFQEYPADRFLVTFFFEGPTVVGPHGDLGFMLEDGVV